jgi:hypothetical protein
LAVGTVIIINEENLEKTVHCGHLDVLLQAGRWDRAKCEQRRRKRDLIDLLKLFESLVKDRDIATIFYAEGSE